MFSKPCWRSVTSSLTSGNPWPITTEDKNGAFKKALMTLGNVIWSTHNPSINHRRRAPLPKLSIRLFNWDLLLIGSKIWGSYTGLFNHLRTNIEVEASNPWSEGILGEKKEGKRERIWKINGFRCYIYVIFMLFKSFYKSLILIFIQPI